jgi:hypothetical protein
MSDLRVAEVLVSEWRVAVTDVLRGNFGLMI